MNATKERLLWALYIFPGIIFGALFVVSISKLLGVGILPPSMHSGFLYEAGKIFKQKPLVIPVLFIIFFGAYLLQGFFTFSERNRNQAFAGTALGGVSISLVILIYTFWELSHLMVSLGASIVVGLLIANYLLSPWKNWLIKKIHERLDKTMGAMSNYLKIVNEIKSLAGDSKLSIFNEIERYKEEAEVIRRRMDDPNALRKADLDSEYLLKKVKLLRKVDTDKDIIDEDFEKIKNMIREYESKFEDKSHLDMLLLYYLPDNELKAWHEIQQQK